MYFEVYAIHLALKTRFAALNFNGPAATWLQTMERKGRITDRAWLCDLVFAKYDKDQYPSMMRQFDSLKQLGSITEYQQKFEELAHGILLYNPANDDTYFVTRFLGGLKEEIRVAIALHRPSDVDTASALALLQEEEIESSKKRLGSRDTGKHSFKSFSPVERQKPAE